MTDKNTQESPIEAVSRILLRETGVVASYVLAATLIDAVRKTTPPRAVTIGMLTKILGSLGSDQLLEEWATRSSRKIVQVLSRHPGLQRVVAPVDDEAIWCTLEGTVAALLLRVCRGQDLDESTPGRSRPSRSTSEPPTTDKIGIMNSEQISAFARHVEEMTAVAWTGTDLAANHAALVWTARAGLTLAGCLRGAIDGHDEDTDADGEIRKMLIDFLELAGFRSGSKATHA